MVLSGAFAGFPIPVQRYDVLATGEQGAVLSTGDDGMQLIPPRPNGGQATRLPISFECEGKGTASGYRLQIEDENQPVMAAILNAGSLQHTAPPWLNEHMETHLRWRVTALGANARVLAQPEWRDFELINEPQTNP